MNNVTENKKFFKTIKPFFTEKKKKTTTNIILTENKQKGKTRRFVKFLIPLLQMPTGSQASAGRSVSIF